MEPHDSLPPLSRDAPAASPLTAPYRLPWRIGGLSFVVAFATGVLVLAVYLLYRQEEIDRNYATTLFAIILTNAASVFYAILRGTARA